MLSHSTEAETDAVGFDVELRSEKGKKNVSLRSVGCTLSATERLNAKACADACVWSCHQDRSPASSFLCRMRSCRRFQAFSTCRRKHTHAQTHTHILILGFHEVRSVQRPCGCCVFRLVYLSLSNIWLPHCTQNYISLRHQLSIRPLTLQSLQCLLPTYTITRHYTPYWLRDREREKKKC